MKHALFNIRSWSARALLILIVAFSTIISITYPTSAANNGNNPTGNDKNKDKNNDKDKAVDKRGPESGEDTIKMSIELVVLDVAVHDRDHQTVTGLTKDTFAVFEDKQPQKIEYFSHEVVPVSIGFVIDTSGSMRLKLPVVIEAAKTMVRLSRPGDEFFVVSFKNKAQLVEEFTSKLDDVQDALSELDASQGTALLDAVYVAADYAHKEAKNRRKALVVVTDGDERDSFYKVAQLIDQLREEDVQVYMIGFPDELNDVKGVFHVSIRDRAVKLMNDIAGESGGRAFFPTSLYDVNSLTEQIGSDVHSQYTIGYYSTNEKRDGSWRRVQVKLAGKETKKLDIRTRSGYFAGQKN